MKRSGKGSSRKTINKKTKSKKTNPISKKKGSKKPPSKIWTIIQNLLHRNKNQQKSLKVYKKIQKKEKVRNIKKNVKVTKKSPSKTKKNSKPKTLKVPSHHTQIDSLYQHINKKEKTTLKELTSTFKISIELATVWTKVLENNNLISIKYPAFGSPIITKVNPKNKNQQGTNKK